MNKSIKAISLLLCLMVIGNASAMKLTFTLDGKLKKTQDKKYKFTLDLPSAKRERLIQDPQQPAAQAREPQEDVIVQPTSLKKQKSTEGAEPIYWAIRTPIDPVWISQINKSLYEAVGQGDFAKVQYLLGFDLNLNELIGPGKMTLLHRAALGGNVDIAKLLLEKGALLDVAMANGKTALHIASECGHLPMVRFLIESGADISARTITTGETPKALAISNIHIAVVGYFNALGAYLAKEASLVEKQHTIPVDSRESILTSSGCTEMAMDFDDGDAVQQLNSIRDVEMDEDIAVVALVSLQRQ